jgi:hypothetical protein
VREAGGREQRGRRGSSSSSAWVVPARLWRGEKGGAAAGAHEWYLLWLRTGQSGSREQPQQAQRWYLLGRCNWSWYADVAWRVLGTLCAAAVPAAVPAVSATCIRGLATSAHILMPLLLPAAAVSGRCRVRWTWCSLCVRSARRTPACAPASWSGWLTPSAAYAQAGW